MTLLYEILTNLDDLMSQSSGFIVQFNDLIKAENINVVTDAAGNLSIDVPSEMSDKTAEAVSKKVGIIDRLINDRSSEIEKLIREGLEIEKDISKSDPNFKSVIQEKASAFRDMKNLYKH